MCVYKIARDQRSCRAANKKARIAAGLNILVFGVGNYTRIIGGCFLWILLVVPGYWIKKLEVD